MSKLILVIDDDPTGVLLIESRLSKLGYDVKHAFNGAQGFELAGQFIPNMIILDIEMPEMNGYSFMVELKKVDALKNIPVVVLTSREDNKPIFFRRGVQDYFIKPINFDMLIPKIEQLIGKP